MTIARLFSRAPSTFSKRLPIRRLDCPYANTQSLTPPPKALPQQAAYTRLWTNRRPVIGQTQPFICITNYTMTDQTQSFICIMLYNNWCKHEEIAVIGADILDIFTSDFISRCSVSSRKTPSLVSPDIIASGHSEGFLSSGLAHLC